MCQFKRALIALFVLPFVFISVAAAAQSVVETEEEKKETPKFKPYSEVITGEALTRQGLFTTHQVEGKLYYQIPPGQLDQEFLWVYQISKTQTGYQYGGYPLGNRVVRWQRVNDRILLRNVEYEKRARVGTPEALGVADASIEAIIKTFKIVTFAPDSIPVIDVSALFTDDTPEFSPKNALRAKSIDKDRTFISSVKAFPINLEIRVTATFKVEPVNFFAPRTEGPPQPRRSDPSLGSVTVEVHNSMIQLPESPMRPREFDNRVGYFTGTFENYTDENVQVEDVRFIKRWRLVKKKPGARLSEPVKPIVYYVGREVPEKWKKYVKEGIEMWQLAFEAAGFKNAIVGKYAPSQAEDPDWDAEDARFSTVRWLPVKTRNAFGPHVADPRTGEILESDIRFFHNHVSTYRNWFFVQASAHAGTKYQKLPYPDELMGRFVRRVVAHEVGHTIGLRHNYRASYAYSVEQLRDKDWTRKNGIVASIMEYARANYVAQPGDNADFISKIGPYDRFAIEWGYREFPKTRTYEEDKKHLDKIAERQLTDPLVRFSGGREDGVVGRGDPTSQTEDLTNDVLEATRLGFLNLERVMGYIVPGTSVESKDYRLLREIYGFVVSQVRTELAHVANQIGGVRVNRLLYGQGADLYEPLPADDQQKALAFLLSNAFEVPSWLVKQEVVSRIGVLDTQNRILQYQQRLLDMLFSGERAKRMADVEASGYETYTLSDMVTQLTAGIFSELDSDTGEIGIFRRNLQRAYVAKLVAQYNDDSAVNNDLRALARYSANRLLEKLKRAEGETNDLMTRAHLYDLIKLIEAADSERS